MMKKVFYFLWVIAFGFGLFAVYQKLAFGDVVTNLGNKVVWGLWVALYIYFIGLSAGAFLLSSLVYVFRVKIFENIGRLALVTALIALICSLISIWFDLGHGFRIYRVITSPNLPSSMMAWMIWLYLAYFILLLFETSMAFKIDSGKLSFNEKERISNILRVLGGIGILLAIIFHGGVGALFGVVASNPFWASALTPVFFLIGAILSGSALLTAILVFFWHGEGYSEKKQMIYFLGRIVLITLLVDLLLEWAEISIALWGGIPEHTEGFKVMMFGDNWWVFWIVHLLIGVIAPAFILTFKSHSTKLVGLATAIIAVTFLSVRLNIIIPGLVVKKIPGTSAFVHERFSNEYFPSLNELMIALFIYSIGIGLFYLGVKYFSINKPLVKQDSG